ncbi:MAG: tRNA (adenosine(37)-N6)-dimethylallyltransferase MiaA [Eubacteriales bacterium]
MKKELLIITGPTAVGKTTISIQVAKQLNGEIISADSCQVYRGMNIGSAKITKQEMEGVSHHLIDVLDPDEPCNVATFQEMAKVCVEDIIGRGKLPIVVGGTGFYIQALLYGIDFSNEEEQTKIRREITSYYEQHGVDALFQRLEECDPVSATMIHKNNIKRVIRAIEYYKCHGRCISLHNEEERLKESPYDFLYVVVTNKRDVLYNAINKRVDHMIVGGLEEEVRGLLAKGYTEEMTSMQAIGYKEVVAYFKGECTREEMIERIKTNTRHFAKRQLTWFRREREVYQMDKSEYKEEASLVEDMMIEWYRRNTV